MLQKLKDVALQLYARKAITEMESVHRKAVEKLKTEHAEELEKKETECVTRINAMKKSVNKYLRESQEAQLRKIDLLDQDMEKYEQSTKTCEDIISELRQLKHINNRWLNDNKDIERVVGELVRSFQRGRDICNEIEKGVTYADSVLHDLESSDIGFQKILD